MLSARQRWYGLTSGLLAVLLVLAGFAVWGVRASDAAGEQVTRASHLESFYGEAELALSQMQSAERGYLLAPDDSLRAQYEAAHEQARQALSAAAALHGTTREQRAAEAMSAQLRVVASRVNRIFASRDAGDMATVATLDRHEDVLYDALTRDLITQVADQREQADGALGRLRTVQDDLAARMPLVFLVGMLLTTTLLIMLRVLDRDLRRRAATDELTRLPNRAAFQAALRRRVAAGGGDVGVLLLDLDHFKDVNDTLGHHVGDALLVQAAARMRGALRPQDLVARLGGDEFAVLLGEGCPQSEAEAVARRMVSSLEQPFPLEGVALQVGGSVGVAYYPQHANDVAQLMQRADVAMYAAKRSSAGSLVYSSELEGSSARQLMLLGQLSGAVERHELVLHYQPVMDLATGRVVGAEALVRWEHPSLGLLPPVEFVPAAEASGALRPVTRYVLEQAALAAAGWAAAGSPLTVSVNVSARNLVGEDLPAMVARVLADSGLPPQQLKLEITESAIMDDPERARAVLEAVAALGVALSVDDFGTGYTSLAYLADLPVAELKIDQSFVSRLTTDDKAAVIVETSVALARRLQMSVVAEGVEDAATLEALRELGCTRVQGYLVDRPLPAAAFWTKYVVDVPPQRAPVALHALPQPHGVASLG